MNPIQTAVNAILTLPDFLKTPLAGGKPITLEGRTLNIDFQILCQVQKLGAQLHKLPVAEARKRFEDLSALTNSEPHKDQTIENFTIPGPGGNVIGMRSYTPAAALPGGPCILFFHGGGNAIGSLNSHHGFCSDFAQQTKAKLISVDYRLGPEHKFPAELEDGTAAYKWLIDHAGAQNIDANRIAIAGDSAGGRMAASLGVILRDEKVQPQPKLLVMIYPSTNGRRQTRSAQAFAQGFMLSKDLLDYFADNHIHGDADRDDPRVSPLLAKDVTGLPEAILCVAGFDPLYDEGLEYAEKLQQAGNKVTILKHDDLGHGYVTMAGVLKRAKQANDEIFAAVQRIL